MSKQRKNTVIRIKPKNLSDLEKYFDLHYTIRPLFRDRVKKDKGQLNEHLDSYYFEFDPGDTICIDFVEEELQGIVEGYDTKEHRDDLVYLARYYETHSQRYMYGIDFDEGVSIFDIDSFLSDKTETDIAKLKQEAAQRVTEGDLENYRQDVLTDEQRDEGDQPQDEIDEEALRAYIYKKHVKPRGEPILVDEDYEGRGNKGSYSIADIEEDEEVHRILKRYHLHQLLSKYAGKNRQNLAIQIKVNRDQVNRDEDEIEVKEVELTNAILDCLNDNLGPSLHEYYKDYEVIIGELQKKRKKLMRIYAVNVIRGLLAYIDNKMIKPGVEVTQADKYEFIGTFLSFAGLGGIYYRQEYDIHPSIKNSYPTYRRYLYKRVSTLLSEDISG